MAIGGVASKIVPGFVTILSGRNEPPFVCDIGSRNDLMAVNAAHAAVAGAPFMGPGTGGALSLKSRTMIGSGLCFTSTTTLRGTEPDFNTIGVEVQFVAKGAFG